MNYENLPVYKDSYDLLVFLYRTTGRIRRGYRYTLGEEIKRSLQDVLLAIYRANVFPESKLQYIAEARHELARVRIHARLLRDLGQLSLSQQVELVDKVASIGKQLTAWERHTQQKHDGSSRSAT